MSAPHILDALKTNGYHVTPIDVTSDLTQLVRSLTPKPELIFNGLYGQGGEDGFIQGIFDHLRIPYTHSNAFSSSLAMNKPYAKIFFKKAGIQVPEGKVIFKSELAQGPPLKFPFIMKPPQEGSSLGVAILHNQKEYDHLLRQGWNFGDEILVETYIPGREFFVTCLEDKALGTVEVVPKTNFYDYKVKYTCGLADHLIPAPVPKAIENLAIDWAKRAHHALGCNNLSRSDFRYDETKGLQGLYMLELNTQPGLTKLSLVPETAAEKGITFPMLINKIISRPNYRE